MTRVYYKDALGAFILFDVTRADTFQAVEKWKTDLGTIAHILLEFLRVLEIYFRGPFQIAKFCSQTAARSPAF